MKKAVVLIVILFTSTLLYPQRFGVKAGFNMASYIGNDGKDAKSILGFQIGGIVEFPISDLFSIQPEIFLSQKGAKFTEPITISEVSGIATTTTTLDIIDKPIYLEMPINMLFKVNVGSGKVIVATGPYIAYGISGKETRKVTLENITTSNEYNLFSKMDGEGVKDLLKRFDAGIGVYTGYELNNGVSLNLGTSLGLIDISNNSGDLKNSSLILSAGYKFRSK